jgi:pyruvate dehydrogenase E1 component beta subunit
VIPSTPADAKGLLIASIRDEDPVMFLEPKRIYRHGKGEVPTRRTRRAARQGPHRPRRHRRHAAVLRRHGVGLRAGRRGSAEGRPQLRDRRPAHAGAARRATVLESVKKTGRCVVVYEAPKTCGYGAELSALIAEKCIEYLEGPIVRVAGFDTPFPYTLEPLYMPDSKRVLAGIEKTFVW